MPLRWLPVRRVVEGVVTAALPCYHNARRSEPVWLTFAAEQRTISYAVVGEWRFVVGIRIIVRYAVSRLSRTREYQNEIMAVVTRRHWHVMAIMVNTATERDEMSLLLVRVRRRRYWLLRNIMAPWRDIVE